ncbi:hypothetical protein M2323_004237 [Rhodoblastus acidophilus]|uniref:hypothetical protein n=1 Tax=Rhodoblastus acidophilus TaxID=1074 RepID=UPI001620BFD0|nr:hypothetical protein [Rhodoblastus acidophilus]MCW2286442.1 hypothetical protein [Rhodoblastus acidophilus]MCW2335291.1 hypothetical protein [Rhodoblastus acidophilus]
MATYETSDGRQVTRCKEAQEEQEAIYEYFGDVVVKGFVQSIEESDDGQSWKITVVPQMAVT